MNLGYLGGCCAVQEIRYLGHSGSPQQAMADFCKTLWTSQRYNYDTYQYVYSYKPSRKIDAHYIFTGVEGYSKADRYGGNAKYGSAFAAFIKKNGLGTVVASSIAPNRANHPTHKVCAWIWTPAPTKLKAWWASYQKKHKGV